MRRQSSIYCQYCHHYYRLLRDYKKHIHYCEYTFHHNKEHHPREEKQEKKIMNLSPTIFFPVCGAKPASTKPASTKPATTNTTTPFPVAKERNEFGVKIPSAQEMFAHMQDMSRRMAVLEEHVGRMRDNMTAKKKRDIVQWLTRYSPPPASSFEEWRRTMIVTDQHVEMALKRNLMQGIFTMLGEILPEGGQEQRAQQDLPIRAFHEKPNVFYIYVPVPSEDGGAMTMNDDDSDKQQLKKKMHWKIMESSEMAAFVESIANKFLLTYIRWERKQYMENPEFKKDTAQHLSTKYTGKIQGIGTSDDSRCRQVRDFLYTRLKQDCLIPSF
jgi:hypothetical protein